MSFEVSSLCDSIDKMMQKHLPLEEVRRRDAAGEPPDHLLEVFADMGLFRLVMSEKEGGLGGSWEQLSIIQERLGYHATMAALLYNRVTCFGMMTLITSGSPTQKQAWIPKLLAGKGAFALALSEAEAGSDAGALQTRAVKSGKNWKITGRKIWKIGRAHV